MQSRETGATTGLFDTLRGWARSFVAANFGMEEPPRSYEEIALDILYAERGVSLASLVERIAEEKMRAERIAGGATLDIAAWGPWVYRAEATEVVKAMLGRSLVLEGEGPHLLAVPASTPAPVSFTPRPRLAWAVGDGCWHT